MLGGVCLAGALLIQLFAHPFGSTATRSDVALTPSGRSTPDAFASSVAAPPVAVAADAVAAPAPASSGLLRADGSAPGLYGGTRGGPTCDATRLAALLTGNPAEAQAWADAVRIRTSDIGSFLASTTSALLRVDTQVNDYGFRGGRARASQVVLQANTAVLVDRSAFPRVRCISGDPLAPLRTGRGSDRYVGAQWTGFRRSTTVVVTPAMAQLSFVLLDVRSGQPFVRLAESLTTVDLDQPSQGTHLAVVAAGGTSTVSATGWAPGSTVTIAFDNPAVTLGTTSADAGGAVVAEVTVPAGALAGQHQITLTSGGTVVDRPTYVVPAEPPPLGRVHPPS